MNWLMLALKEKSVFKPFAMKFLKDLIFMKTGFNVDIDILKLNIEEDDNNTTKAHIELDLSANSLEFKKLLDKLAK